MKPIKFRAYKVTLEMMEEPETLSDGTRIELNLTRERGSTMIGTFEEYEDALYTDLTNMIQRLYKDGLKAYPSEIEGKIKAAEDAILKKKADELEAKVKAETEAARLKQLELEKVKTQAAAKEAPNVNTPH